MFSKCLTRNCCVACCNSHDRPPEWHDRPSIAMTDREVWHDRPGSTTANRLFERLTIGSFTVNYRLCFISDPINGSFCSKNYIESSLRELRDGVEFISTEREPGIEWSSFTALTNYSRNINYTRISRHLSQPIYC